MNQDNSVIAICAAFAGFLLILLVTSKIWTDYLDVVVLLTLVDIVAHVARRKSPRYH